MEAKPPFGHTTGLDIEDTICLFSSNVLQPALLLFSDTLMSFRMSTTDMCLPFISWPLALEATNVSNEGLFAQGGTWHVVSLGAAMLEFNCAFVRRWQHCCLASDTGWLDVGACVRSWRSPEGPRSDLSVDWWSPEAPRKSPANMFIYCISKRSFFLQISWYYHYIQIDYTSRTNSITRIVELSQLKGGYNTNSN